MQDGKRSNSLIKNISKKCNTMTQKQQLKSASYACTFKTSINIDRHKIIVIIDSDTTEIFMFKKLTDSKEFAIQKKNNSYNLIVVDENPLSDENERVMKETRPLSVAIQHHHEKITFDIVWMTTHNIVLEMSWLQKHNSDID